MGDNHTGDAESFRDYCIPNYIFSLDEKSGAMLDVPNCPVLVFVNSRSGGQLGGKLLRLFRELLNTSQVFDLEEEAPDKVLHRIYQNLEYLKHRQDMLATEIEQKLRMIVAGGDGTASWLLGVVSDMKLRHPPAVATIPLGTGNNIHFSFGWGKKNPVTDRDSVKNILDQVSKAREMKIDSWHIIMRMKAAKEGSCDPITPIQLPHSLHAFNRVSKTDDLNMEGYNTYRGGFWNYFSMGMDAQISYAFHSARKLHPEKFKSQLANQSTYVKLGCSQGWFCASLVQNSSRNIAQLTKVRIIKKAGGDWTDLSISERIRSIVCLNLPSFSGGLNPWGTPSQRKSRNMDFTPALVDDGLLEIVGFKDAWHGLLLLSSKGHGTRLAQAHRVQFEFQKGAANNTYMRLDGEPWKQPLPKDNDTVLVEISHCGQVKMLATGKCQSKSMADELLIPSTPDQDYELEPVEERRKFGAADTFKLPQ